MLLEDVLVEVVILVELEVLLVELEVLEVELEVEDVEVELPCKNSIQTPLW